MLFPLQFDNAGMRKFFGSLLHGTVRHLGIGCSMKQYNRTPHLRQLKSPRCFLELGFLTDIPEITTHRVPKIPTLQGRLGKEGKITVI